MTRGEIAFAIITGLLINEATDICPWLAIRLVRLAARLRYLDAPERAATRGEEFAALINDRPGKLFKLCTALGLTLHALTLVGLRAAWRKLRPRRKAPAQAPDPEPIVVQAQAVALQSATMVAEAQVLTSPSRILDKEFDAWLTRHGQEFDAWLTRHGQETLAWQAQQRREFVDRIDRQAPERRNDQYGLLDVFRSAN
jgi:hypothetical protein